MKKRILCFGDSNTWGYNPADGSRYPEDVRWTGLLQKELGKEYTVLEEGQNGRTTVFFDPVENRISGIDYFHACLESCLPLDLIVLMLGTNDLKVQFCTDPRMSALGLTRYVNAVRIAQDCGDKPKVLLVSPVRIAPAYLGNPLFAEMYGPQACERSGGFAEAYRLFAEENNLSFLNAAAITEPGETDGIHLEREGHKKLAAEIARRILSLT